MVHDGHQGVPNVRAVVIVVGARHGCWEQEPEWEDILAWLHWTLKVDNGEGALIVSVVIGEGRFALIGTFTPLHILVAHQPDDHVVVGPTEQ